MKRRDLLLGIVAGRAAHGWQEGPAEQSTGPAPATRIRPVYNFDFDWRFHLGDLANGMDPALDDSGWQPVQLPHDWSIALEFRPDITGSAPGDFSQKGIGWYRRAFDLPAGFDGKVLVDFDGIYQNSRIWLNGVEVGGRAYGLVPFQVDLSQAAIRGGRNLLAVRADNETGSKARWYSGSGMNRHARLSLPPLVRIPSGGLRVTTTGLSADFAELAIQADLVNGGPEPATVLVRTVITSPDGKNEGVVTTGAVLPAGGSRTLAQSLMLRSPSPWAPENPSLYDIRCEVSSGGAALDDETARFGVRLVQWHPDFGMMLNGRTTKLRGVNMHVDCGAVGTGAPRGMFERRLRILKDLGCNAIRVAHHPAPAEFLDLCDEMGFLVIEEAFDKWNLGIAEGYEHPRFSEDWDHDLRAMISRDRNRPCIIAWSVGNEAGYPGTEDHDVTLFNLATFVKTIEPTRAVTCAFLGSNEGTIEDNVGAILKAGRPLDFLSLNYLERYFPLLRASHPTLLITATESYPFYRSRFGGVEPFNNWYDATSGQWITGSFVWTGYDYLGESAGWPSKGWPNGLIDTCGYPKPGSLFHRTVWSTKPVVGIHAGDPNLDADPGLEYWRFPPTVAHWNLTEGATYAVYTPSNAETVELVVNGFSYGRKAVAQSANQSIVWFVRHQRGELRALARIGEEIVAEAALRSAGKAVDIRVQLDHPRLRAGGQDVCHAEIALVDENGVVVPDGDRQIRLGLAGPATLLGMDNGDLRDHEPYASNARRTRQGRCLAILRAWRQQGEVLVWADADELPSTYFRLQVEAPLAVEPIYPSPSSPP
ncbi:MAG: DUF4982 domain-containing protein [Bryobacterales bacterium]|nr:DUF4982 domain-containing protein [Bryobacterales bacterium]